jgi:hypothetical protein
MQRYQLVKMNRIAYIVSPDALPFTYGFSPGSSSFSSVSGAKVAAAMYISGVVCTVPLNRRARE